MSDTGMFIVGEQKRWTWSGMRTYRPTSHESAMDHASRSSLWTGSLARNGFLFFVQTVRKIITGRLKASWRVGCEGVRRSGKSMGESRRMGRNSSQQNLEGRPPCRPGASDAAPTERRPPGAMERDFLEGRPPCRPGASEVAPTERRPPRPMERDFLEGRPLCRPGIRE